MAAFFGVIAFYAVAAAIVEAALQALYRLYKGIRRLICRWKKETLPKVKSLNQEWAPISKLLQIIASILLVKLLDVSLINILADSLLNLPDKIDIGILDTILTGLMISRGSNFLHDFIERQKHKMEFIRATNINGDDD